MGIEDYDLIWQDLEVVMKTHGYQICSLYNSEDGVLKAVFEKEEVKDDEDNS